MVNYQSMIADKNEFLATFLIINYNFLLLINYYHIKLQIFLTIENNAKKRDYRKQKLLIKHNFKDIYNFIKLKWY
jgi:hypothetical protein